MSALLNIAIQGWGAAGKARAQACDDSPHFKLKGIISRRLELGTLTLLAALQDPTVEAIAISTENTHHPQAVRQALQSGKHVLCDYPLSWKVSEAKALYQLAKENNLILHVEHLSLISQAHLELKAQLKLLGKLESGEYCFQAGWSEKWGDHDYRGPLSILAYPRLMQVADWFGAFKIISQHLSEDKTKAQIKLELEFADGSVLNFIEERKANLPRQRQMKLKGKEGKIHWDGGTIEKGLFAKDLEWFYERIRTGKPAYYDEEMTLKVLTALEQL